MGQSGAGQGFHRFPARMPGLRGLVLFAVPAKDELPFQVSRNATFQSCMDIVPHEEAGPTLGCSGRREVESATVGNRRVPLPYDHEFLMMAGHMHRIREKFSRVEELCRVHAHDEFQIVAGRGGKLVDQFLEILDI